MNRSTQRHAFALEYVKTVGVHNNATMGRGFASPVDLAVSGDGRIYVLNRGPYARAGVCNLDEDYLYEFGSLGDGDGQFTLASAIALDSRGRVYVADEHHSHINVFEHSGEFIGRWGQSGSGKGQMDGPSGLVFDRDDRLFVADQNNNRVSVFTSRGAHIRSWGEPGDEDGQLNLPWGIALDAAGHVYVADWRNDRVQKFTAEGEFLASFGGPGDGDGRLHRPSSVAVDSDGYIHIGDWGNERVQVLAPDGRFLLKLRGQATESAWAREFLVANPDEKVERNRSVLYPQLPLHLDTPYLVSAQTEPYFWGPIVNLDADDRLYVTEMSRHRFQVYGRV